MAHHGTTLSRRLSIVAMLVATSWGLAASGAPSASAAAAPNPCTVFTKAEIAKVFGGKVAKPTVGRSTPASKECQFKVGAAGARPAGAVAVRITSVGAQSAYKGLTNAADYVAVPQLPNSYYGTTTAALSVLKGDVLITVQGLFADPSATPVHPLDTEAQLIKLATLGIKRV
jgi:hypothetical protein